MQPFRLKASALVFGLAAASVAGAPSTAFADNLIDARSALSSSIELLRRALHLGGPQDEVLSHAISISNREATLELELTGGATRTLSLRGGRVYVNGELAGSYTPGGALDRAWRRALADGASLDTRALLVAMRAWRGPSLTGDEAAAKTRLDAAMRGLEMRAVPTKAVAAQARAATEAEAAAQQAGTALRLGDLAALDTLARQVGALEGTEDIGEVLRTAAVQIGNVTVAAGQRHNGDLVVLKGGADISGEVTGSVVSVFGDVTLRGGARVGRDAVSLGGSVTSLDGAEVGGTTRIISQSELLSTAAAEAAEAEAAPGALDRVFEDVRNIVALFIALAMVGFGTVFFGRRYLEVVADTASHAFGRSFVVGLLGQLLLLPTFAMMIVGLIFTVVGILVLPFAAVAFVIAAILAVVGGYLAVAHSIGETFTRRRMAHGAFVRAPNAYGYLFAGLLGLLGLWAAAALTGWMGPVVIVFKVAAVIVTWLAITTGFGAVLLSRAGLRETFAGRHVGEMSDEYLWATPPAGNRMKMEQK